VWAPYTGVSFDDRDLIGPYKSDILQRYNGVN